MNKPRDERSSLLAESIEIFHEHESKSKFDCLAMVMGYVNFDGEHDTYIKKD